MDELDTPILRALFSDVHAYPARSEIRESISGLARKLGISEPTLRSRLRGYVRSGFLQGWRVFINPNVTREQAAQVHMDIRPPSSKEDVIDKILLVDGVFLVSKCHGNAVGVCLYADGHDGLRKRVELLARFATAEHVACGPIAFPPCSHRFTPTDVAIIRSIQEAPRLGYASIAKRAGTSVRTARRRLNRMIRDTVLFVTPTLDYRRLKGAIAADILVFYANRDVAKEMDRRVLSVLDKVVVQCITGCPEHLWASVHLDSPAQADEILGRLTRLKGVREAYVNLVEEYLQEPEVFGRQIEKLSALCEHRPMAGPRWGPP